VHQSIKTLRTGESRVAIACGTQVILNPEMFIGESKLKMLSATGKSRMWDADADGYARGEGIAAVVLKRLSDAIADGDHIECIIRETGTNQDGFSNGITMPSTEAQAALIRQTYAKAGLDPLNNPQDRPQFFEAHGTGTKAGDPKEAAAIAKSFPPLGENGTPLYVGSVKTVIGHLEGSAGLAGLLKASAMIQNGSIAPNLLFNRLNPDLEPYIKGLHVPTSLTPWPALAEGVPRRVSVNSFGFGGSNAHAILEQAPAVSGEVAQRNTHTLFSPFVFSASSEVALVGQLRAYSDYLKKHSDIDATDLAWTLQSRRSQLSTKIPFSARTIEQLTSKIDAKLAALTQTPGSTLGIRSNAKHASILGIFTGQGAQWAAMGADLIRSSAFASQRIQELEDALATLPAADRPAWSLREEMLAGDDTSRIAEAALSQPLCTAIQVVLVDLLKYAGIGFTAVVGHSSGEIGAAYAAGFLSARDSIRVAYYRGLYAKLAGSSKNNQKGAMLAVGTSLEDAQDLVNLRAFKGRLAVAAHNSSASVTMSGDADALIHAKKVFDEEKKFTRMLKVDTAYHSHHMLPCGDPYVASLKACGVKVIRDRADKSCSWFSSVTPSNKPMEAVEELQDEYWRDNMTNAVLFADAVRNAVASDEQINLAIEVGPHPALKGPASQNIAEVRPANLPYCGVLSRGKNDVDIFSEALGFVWTHLPNLVDFQSFEKAATGDESRQPKLVVGLPAYQWNHGRSHWSESRISRKMRGRKQVHHEVLGFLSTDSNAHEMRWANVLKPSEISWLSSHQLQGQPIFPAAGYVAMALEASKVLVGDKKVEVFELNNLIIPRAIVFEEENDFGVETLVTLTGIQYHADQTATADFACYSVPVLSSGSDQQMELMSGGNVRILFGDSNVEALSVTVPEDYNMTEVDPEALYSTFSELGYGYFGPFRTMTSMKRRLNQSSVMVDSYCYTDAEVNQYMVHPTMLDVAFQASMLAYSAPGDERLWTLSVPTAIGTIRVNPEVCAALPTSGSKVPVCATLDSESEFFSASIDLFSEDGEHGMIQIEDLIIKPFAPASKEDDRVVFTHTKFDFALPDAAAVANNVRPSSYEAELATVCERISYHYVRKWKAELSAEEWANGEQHWKHLSAWVNQTITAASRGQHASLKKEWSSDSVDEIKALISRYSDSIDVKLLVAVGDNLPTAVRGETTILEHMTPNNMLGDWYKTGLGFAKYNSFLGSMMKQISHRYPHTRILEIGAGASGATQSVLDSIGDKFSSYTYTDASEDSLTKAAELFKPYSDKMMFKTLDIEKAPAGQGYELNSYDVVIASNALHATSSIQTTLENARKLLRPGGYLILLEITGQGPVRFHSILGSLPSWWLGVNDSRKSSPLLAPGGWHTALRKAGFGGVDSSTPEIDRAAWPLSIMVSQAVNDRVQFMRRPLSSPKASIQIESLVILGNGSLESSRIGDEVMEHLGRFCGEVTVLNSLPTEDEALNLNPMSTFLNLVDIDSPIFKDMTEEKMNGLKRMLELAKCIVWVTQGALLDQSYHNASITFSRTIKQEAGYINLNHIDLSDLEHNESKAIAEYLLQVSALEEWDAPPSVLADRQHREFGFLWSRESEVFLDRGKLKIPRLLENIDQNARLNSDRRVITKTVPINGSNVSVMSTSVDSPSSVVELVGRKRNDNSNDLIKIETSTLMALHVAEEMFLFLGIGKGKDGKLQVLLSTANACETAAIASVAAPADVDADSLLIAVASELLAESLLQQLSADCHILVHCSAKDRFLAAALSRRAAGKAVRVTFTCDSQDEQPDATWIPLDSRAHTLVMRKMLRSAKPTHFLDMTATSAPSALSVRIAQGLPAGYTRIDPSALFQGQSSSVSLSAQEILVGRLENAVAAVGSSSLQVQDMVTPLGQLRALSHKHATSAIHWPSDGLIEVEVRPLDSRSLFSKDKSYLLVGLTGQIGQSICEWMVSNGAGHVYLTSRRPKVEAAWLNSFRGTGATVKVIAMDVLDTSSLENAVKEIRANSPPIAGIFNGAMVLIDHLFATMSTEIMQRVLGPKIDGTNNLDDFFYDDDLDFFVLLSSSAAVLGNAGQTNYTAANGYLEGIAKQRRRRGLAASAVDIGRVTGIGLIETANQAVVEQLRKLRLAPISELDLRQMMAETIYAGYSTVEDRDAIPEVVVTTGLRVVDDDEDIKGPWFSNAIFSHLVRTNTSAVSGSDDQDKKTSLPVGQQISMAADKEEALDVLKGTYHFRN
jgi:hybrid polyketide synthase/nonribosomal peptide synthetase ACE1